MALTFPLSYEEFASKLFLEDATFAQQRSDETTGMGSLDILNATLATPLWRVDCVTGPIENEDAEALASLIEILEQPGKTFYISNPRKVAPRADPTGSILGAANPTISALNSNNKQLSITGLPVGYTLSQGDMFSFTYGPGGSPRRALHRFAGSATASAGGVISDIEISDFIRAGAEVGNVVKLVQPVMLAKLIPGSYKPKGRGSLHQTFSFSAMQRLI